MSGKGRDITGLRFGRLMAIEPTMFRSSNHVIWRCICDCGTPAAVTANALYMCHTKSCGCIQVEATINNVKHGNHRRGYRSSEYFSWASMKYRCLNPNAKAYRNYGGRGIMICGRWMDFEKFYADMGSRPRGTTLDRINNNGNYEPGNCRWATRKVQNRNRRRLDMFNSILDRLNFNSASGQFEFGA